MQDQYLDSLIAARSIIFSGLPFSWNDLTKHFLENNLIPRIQLGFTLGDYITELTEDGIISYNSMSGKYEMNKISLDNDLLQ
jgi:hypothetical protein